MNIIKDKEGGGALSLPLVDENWVPMDGISLFQLPNDDGMLNLR